MDKQPQLSTFWSACCWSPLRVQRRRMAVGWALALLLAWLFNMIVADPVAAQAITPSSPCLASSNLTNLSGGGNRGITNQPVISGNGARVSFWSVNNLGGANDDGNIEIFVRETGSNAITQLTDSVGSILGGFNLEPSINAAGTHIAFYSDRDLVSGQNTDGNFEIFLARRANNGTWSITQITHTEGSANLFPSINAAGNRIAFVSDDAGLHSIDQSRNNADRNFEIFLAAISANGTVQFRQVTNTGAGVTNDQPVINASGNRIAFTASSGQTAQVLVWDERNSSPTQLTQTDSNDQPSISADGTSIVYISTTQDDRSRVVLHTLSEDGSESRAEVIVPPASNTTYRSPSISGNGERVVYVAEQDTADALQINVLLYDLNTGLGVPISDVSGGTGEQPAISRDGTRVTFVGVQAVGGTTDNAGSDIYLNECPLSDLAVSFVNPPTTSVLAGEDVAYQLRVTNRGPSLARDVFFRLEVGALPTNISPILPGGCENEGDGTFVCTLGNLAVNGSRNFSFGYEIPSNAGLGDLVSRVEVGANAVDSHDDDNRTPEIRTRVFEESSLSLSVTADRATILAGSAEELTYDLVVTNAGPSQARTVRLTDTLPSGVTYVSAQLVQGGGAGADCPIVANDTQVVCALGNLNAGNSALVRIKIQAKASAPPTLSNVATVRSLTQESNLADNTVTTQTVVDRAADMLVTKVASPSPAVVAGREITYTLTLTNAGPADTLNVSVIDSLPPNVTYVRNVSPSGTVCTPGGGGQVVTCNLPGNLAVGASRNLRIVALIDSVAPAGTITNTARVFSDRRDPNSNNDVSPPVTTTVTLLSDLVVTKSVNKTTPDVFEEIVYTIKVRNAGPSQAYDVVVDDMLPPGMTFVDATATQGSYDEVTGVWTVGTLPVRPAGQEQTLTIRAYAELSVGGQSVVNTATASGSQPEPPGGLTNSTASVTITPQMADVQVTKSSVPDSPTGVTAGERLTYTLTVRNDGPSVARSVRLTDVLPSDVYLISTTAPVGLPGCTTGTTVACDVGSMAADTQLDYTVVVTRSLKGMITNTVSVSSLTPDDNLANNVFTHTIRVNPNEPDHLVFTQQPPSIETAGAFFSPAPVIEIRDRFNNTIDAPNEGHDDEIILRAFTNSSCSIPASDPEALRNGVLEATDGVAIFATLNYTRSVPRIYLRAENGTRDIDSDCSSAVSINAADTKKLLITSEPRFPIAGKVSEEIRIERRDEFDNLTTDGQFVVNLADSSPTGVFVNDSIGSTVITTVTIPSESSSATFFYTDTVQGTYFITVSGGSGVTPDSQPVHVRADTASELLVVITAPVTVTAGIRSEAITIQRIDQYGNPNFTDDTITVTLGSDSPPYQFFNDLNEPDPIIHTTIPYSSSQTTFHYRSTLAGEHRLHFADASAILESAEWDMEVKPAVIDHLVFSTTARTVIAGELSDVIQVAREDAFNNRIFEAGDLEVVLASSSISVPTFLPTNPVTIAQGSDYVEFYYADELADTHVITASAAGASPATQEITVTASTPERLVVLTPAQDDVTAGVPSDEIIIQRQDRFGNPAPDDDELVVSLESTSSSYAFVPLTDTVPSLASVTITDTNASFRYLDTTVGAYEMSFNGGGGFTASQPITVTSAGPHRLFFRQAPTTATAGLRSGRFVVELQDAFENTTTHTAPVVVNLSTNSPGTDIGESPYFISGDSETEVTSVQIPTGVPTATFYYNDTRAGTALITVDDIGSLVAATTTVTVQPRSANNIAFFVPTTPITAGIPSEVITVEVRDIYANPVTPTLGSPVALNLTTTSDNPNANFRAANAPENVITQITIAGTSTERFRYYDETAGLTEMQLQGSIGQFEQEVEVVANDVAQVVFVSNPVTTIAGEPSELLTIERQDAYGNSNDREGAITVELSTDSPAGDFFSDTVDALLLNNQVTIPANSSQVSFRYTDTLKGAPTLTVTVLSGLDGDSQQQTVLGAEAVRLQITGDDSQEAGSAQPLALFAYDRFGNQSDLYTGTHTLRFDGASVSLSGTHTPTVTSNLGTPITFGDDTPVTFRAGEAVAGGSLTLYRRETAVITATDVLSNIHAMGVDALTVTVNSTVSSQVRAETESSGSGEIFPDGDIAAGQAITLYAVLRDDYDNFVDAAADATWHITRTGGVTNTDISPIIGAYTVFSPTAPGTAIIEPSINGLISIPSGLISVAPADAYAVTVESNANGSGELVTARVITAGTSITIYAVTRDVLGNFINDNTPATWELITTTGGVTTSANLTPINGSTGAIFTGTLVGSGQIRATRAGVPVSTPSEVITVIPGDAMKLILTMEDQGTNITAGETRKLSITAVDAQGNVATRYDGEKMLIFSGPMTSTRPATAPTVVDGNGIAQVAGTPTLIEFVEGVAQNVGTVADLTFYRAQSGALTVTDGVISSDPILFTVVPDERDKISISADETVLSAGVPVSLTLYVEDAYGNLIDYTSNSRPLVFASIPDATAPDTTPATVYNRDGTPLAFGSTTGIDFTNGVAAADNGGNGVMTIYKAGTFVITVDDTGTGAVNEAKPSGALTVTVLSGPLDALEWSVTDPQINDAAFSNGTLTALDEFGNVTTNIASSEFPIQVTVNTTGTVFFDGSGVDNELESDDFDNGVADLSNSPTGAALRYTGPDGMVVFEARSQSGVVGTTNVDIHPGILDALSLTGPVTATAGEPFTVTITARDVSGNLINGAQEIIFSGASTAPDSLSQPQVNGVAFDTPSTVTFTNGIATVPVTLTNVVMTVFTATIGSVTSNELSITVEPGEVHELILAGPNIATSGSTFNLTITARDFADNLIADGTQSITFAGAYTAPDGLSHPQANGVAFGVASTVTFTNGIATVPVNLTKAEVTTLTATIEAVTPIVTSNEMVVTVEPAELDSLSLTGPITTTAGIPFNVTMTARDIADNLVANGPQTMTFYGASTAPDGLSQPLVNGVAFGVSSTVTFTNGVATVPILLTNADVTTLTATIGDVNSNSLEVTVQPADLAALQWSVTTPQINGAVFTNGTLTARDTYHNLVTELDTSVTVSQTSHTGSVVFTNLGGSNLLAPNHFVNGVAELGTGGAGLLYTGESGTVTFQAESQSGVVGTTNIEILPGTLDALSLTGPVTATAGSPFNVTVTARDISGNLIANGPQTIAFSGALTAPDGLSQPQVNGVAFGVTSTVTFTNGIATVPVILTNADVTTLTATIGTVTSDEMIVTVQPADLAALQWSVTGAQPSGIPFTAGSTLTARDQYSNTTSNFDDLVTIAALAPATGTVALSGGEAAQIGASDFANGIADLNALGLHYTGATGSITLEASSDTGVIDTVNVTIVPGPPAMAYIQGYTDTVASLSNTLTVTTSETISLSIRLFDSAHNPSIDFDGLIPLVFTLTPNPGVAAEVTDADGGAPITINGVDPAGIHFDAGVSHVTPDGRNGQLTLHTSGTYTLTVTKDAPNPIETQISHALVITIGEASMSGLGIPQPEQSHGISSPVSSDMPNESVLLEPPQVSTLGARVWFDENQNGLQENGEVGIEGVQVDLYTAADTLVGSATTDASGNYLFTDLTPGSYYVEFANVPGYHFTRYNVEGNSLDDIDSDVLVPWLEVGVAADGEALPGEPLRYTIFYTNTDTDMARKATNVLISTTIPTSARFVEEMSDPGWHCGAVESDEVCTLTLAELPANAAGSARLVTLPSTTDAGMPDSFDLRVHLSQGTLGRTEVMSLGAGETHVILHAGLVRTEAMLHTSVSARLPDLPAGEQPKAERFIFLPQVESEK